MGCACAGSSMPMPVVLRHAIDICRGLQELHAQDMAMGSLKPVILTLCICNPKSSSIAIEYVQACL